jgi:hypothetical protein
MTTIADRLKQLGMTAAATDVEVNATRFRKMAKAYELYRFVAPEKIAAFNEKLKAKSFKAGGGLYGQGSYEQLIFTPIATYPAVPPTDVLDALEGAMAHDCFDAFEIAQITELSVPKPDPILFGRIAGCDDRFFIAQWDDDVKIEDLLTENEGYFKGIVTP